MARGYTRSNRSRNEKGFDINRWTWQRKVKHWKEPFNIVAVSQWLADCAQNSYLMKDWPVTTIPNCLNTDVWMPVDKSLARNMLGLPIDVPIIAFGTYGANSEHHKGFDLLVEALKNLKSRVNDISLLFLGKLLQKIPPELGFKVNFIGHLHDELSLRLLYSAIDMLVVPSPS